MTNITVHTLRCDRCGEVKTGKDTIDYHKFTPAENLPAGDLCPQCHEEFLALVASFMRSAQ